MSTTTFTTAKVTIIDRITEYFKMRRYMRNFRKAKAERTQAMIDISREKKHITIR